MPSFILIHPTVWPQCRTSQTVRPDRQRSDSIGRTVLQTVAQKDNLDKKGRPWKFALIRPICCVEQIFVLPTKLLFSERELTFTFAICCCRSVCRLSVVSSVCLSVTLVHPTQAVEIFGNISTSFGTLALTSTKNFTEIVPGNPSATVGVKHKRGSKI